MAAFGDHRIEAIARRARDVGWANDEIVREATNQTLVVRARRSPIEGFWLVIEDVSELRRLNEVLEQEDYLRAIAIRDEIKKRKR